MKIGIIGAGNIGGNLTRRFTEAGHEVRVANSRSPETLSDLAKETGASAVDVAEAARDAQVVIFTIPQNRVKGFDARMLDIAAPGAVIVDTGNYYPQQRDGLIAELEDGQPESQWVAEHLGRPVVKAFNNIYFEHLISGGLPAGDPNRRALPVAGDEAAPKQAVIDLLDQIGFDGVDTGTLAESWKQQPGTPSYGIAANADDLTALLDKATAERTAEWRA
ncbi:MAG: putative dinucleotide-binding enzyme [Glaciecola sp.]|jgi:predicted dinucleotide-binding enzyme